MLDVERITKGMTIGKEHEGVEVVRGEEICLDQLVFTFEYAFLAVYSVL